MTEDLLNLFSASAAIERAGPDPAALPLRWEEVPAKCAVYLLVGEDAERGGEGPLLLATVGNLRAALQRRLTTPPPEGHSKRIPYAQVCTRVYWRTVHSPFAANYWYARAARALFPDTYRELLSWRFTWWLAVERQAIHPRLRRTSDPSDPALRYAGPIRDKSAAGKLIETVEDLFDLCRYHHVLVQAPHGKPCAYKEMGKCPAPCDGSVPLDWYTGQMEAAFTFITGETRDAWRAATDSQMRAAAAKMAFEQAARIKQRLVRSGFVDTDPFDHLAPFEQFAFLSLQPGKGRVHLEPWLIRGGEVECLEQFHKKEIPAAAERLFELCNARAAAPAALPTDTSAAETIGLVAHHLFRGDADAGMYLRLRDLRQQGPGMIVAAAEAMLSRKSAAPLMEQASDNSREAPADAAPPPEPAAADDSTRVSLS